MFPLSSSQSDLSLPSSLVSVHKELDSRSQDYWHIGHSSCLPAPSHLHAQLVSWARQAERSIAVQSTALLPALDAPQLGGGLLSRKVARGQEKARLERPYSLTCNPWTLANSWALAIICHTDMGTKSRFMGLEVLKPQCPPPYDCPHVSDPKSLQRFPFFN